MTAIAAVVHRGKVFIGADSGGADAQWNLVHRADPKVFVSGRCVIGFTTSFRMGQLLRHALTIPEQDGEDTSRYMVTTFIDAVRDCLKAGGYAEKEKEAEKAGEFIVGYQGRIFAIGPDYQVGELVDGYAACGSGEAVILGTFYATPKMAPVPRIEKALAAAEHHNIGCRGPFLVLREP